MNEWNSLDTFPKSNSTAIVLTAGGSEIECRYENFLSNHIWVSRNGTIFDDCIISKWKYKFNSELIQFGIDLLQFIDNNYDKLNHFYVDKESDAILQKEDVVNQFFSQQSE